MKKTKKIRVLQISKLYYPWIGGVEKVVQDIAEGLKDKVHMEVLVCKSKGKGERKHINGVKVTKSSSLGICFGMPISITFPFLYAIKSRKADILHFHLNFPLAKILHLVMGPRRQKVVVTYHGDIVRQKKFFGFFYKLITHMFLKRANVILPTSSKLIESSPYLRPYKAKCKVVPLSIDLKKFCGPPKKVFDLGIAPNDKVVLFVGRLCPYKGVEYLIQAMRDVEAKLLIVGEGPLREKLEKKAKFLRVDKKIKFLGKISTEKLKYCYDACDVFVLPSIENSEAFGIVQLEAMAYGKPVVNTNLPTGVPEVSKDGETGITVAPKDSKGLAQAINRILNNKELAAKFSENAIKKVKEKFTRENMLESIYCVYTSLIG